MIKRHVMHTEATTPNGSMAQCPVCSARRFIRRDGRVEWIEQGDFWALHDWSTSELALGAEIKDGR